MGLGLTTGGSGGGDIKPYIKYDAKAGRLFRADRNQLSDGSYVSESVEITNVAQFVADLANIRVGWINYSPPGAIRHLAPIGSPIPPRPDDKNSEGKPAFKQGFELDVMLDQKSDGGVKTARVLGSAAGCVIEAMDALHDAFTAAPESKAGKLPVVKIAGVTPVKSGQSTNYKPDFAIVSWIDRPPAMAAQAQASPTSAAPATGSRVVGAPTPLPVNNIAPQQAAAADALGFG